MRRKRSNTHSAANEPRTRRRVHDEAAGKLAEFAHCPGCGALYREGRWTWQPAPEDAYEHTCPACERIESSYPAGVLQIAGKFAESHREELIGLVRNIEARERTEHPLKRIMSIDFDDDGIHVSLTDAKLAQSLGRALHHAYEGRLERPTTTSEPEQLMRIRWSRD